jgi:hypothetical protein
MSKITKLVNVYILQPIISDMDKIPLDKVFGEPRKLQPTVFESLQGDFLQTTKGELLWIT